MVQLVGGVLFFLVVLTCTTVSFGTSDTGTGLPKGSVGPDTLVLGVALFTVVLLRVVLFVVVLLTEVLLGTSADSLTV